MADTDKFSDQDIVARTIFGEARGEGYLGQQAVANVIMNRVKLDGWRGHDPRSVCLKSYQFSCWLKSDPNRSKLMAITKDDATFAQCYGIAGAAMAGDLPDITHGADSYCVTGTDAFWAKGLTPVAVIGHHSFYVT